MSLSKHTKAELLEMLSSHGIDAKSSMKKAKLIELLEKRCRTKAYCSVRTTITAMATRRHNGVKHDIDL